MYNDSSATTSTPRLKYFYLLQKSQENGNVSTYSLSRPNRHPENWRARNLLVLLAEGYMNHYLRYTHKLHGVRECLVALNRLRDLIRYQTGQTWKYKSQQEFLYWQYLSRLSLILLIVFCKENNIMEIQHVRYYLKLWRSVLLAQQRKTTLALVIVHKGCLRKNRIKSRTPVIGSRSYAVSKLILV